MKLFARITLSSFTAIAQAGETEGLLHGLRAHGRPGQREAPEGLLEVFLHLSSQPLDGVDQVHELTHEFILLVLEELVPAPGQDEPFLQSMELHPGGIDGKLHIDLTFPLRLQPLLSP